MHRAIKPSQRQQGTKDRLGFTFKLNWAANKPQTVSREREDDLDSIYNMAAFIAFVGAENRGIKPSEQKQGTKEHLWRLLKCISTQTIYGL